MILVTGAAGKTGRAIIEALIKRNAEQVNALVYRSAYVEQVKEIGAGNVTIGDMRDLDTLLNAFKRASVIYHICPNMSPDEISIGEMVLEAARRARVERIVYHSVFHPHVEKMAHHWNKMRVEEMIFESGLDFTILQPTAYMQNILGQWSQIINEGIYQIPYRADSRQSMIDLEDVVEVAAKVILEDGHGGAIYELAGPEVLSQQEIVGMLTSVLGRPVQVKEISLDVWEKNVRKAGLSNYAIDTLMSMFRYYDNYGFSGNSNVLSLLLGRKPHTFMEFVSTIVD